MKTLRSAAVALAAGALASTVLATAGTAHAADTAVITVSVVDQYGQPAAVALQAVDTAGNSYYDGNPSAPPITTGHTFTALPAGGYGFVSIGPWSGVECFGVTPCAPGGGLTATAPVVTVSDAGQGSYTAHVTMPTVAGASKVGSPLTIQTSPGYQLMQSLAASQTHLDPNHTQQWVRGTTDVAGSTGPGYTLMPADGGQPVAARLTSSPAVAATFAAAGYTVPPYTTRPVQVDKNATKTKVKLVGGLIRVTVKSAGGAVPTGKVKLKLGSLSKKAKLKKGKAKVRVPQSIEPGTYSLKVRYLGATGFEKSKSKKLTVTVH